MLRTIVRNIVANWIGFAVQVAVTFFLTPFVLHTLGDARYGAWALLMGLTGYYGLFDLGFRAGLTQFLARYLAEKDFDKLNRTASTGFVSLSLIGLFLALATLVLAWVAPAIFNFPPGTVTEVRWAIVIVGLGVAIQFPFFTFSAVFPATQRFDISNAIGIATRLLTAAATVAFLKCGCGLVGVATATMAGSLIDYGLRWHQARRVLPELSLSPRSANLTSFWEFTNFGVWNVLIANSRRFVLYSGTLVIGLFMPAAAIAVYALAGGIVDYFNRMIIPIAAVFFPAVTHLDARGETETVRRLYLKASRLLLTASIAAGLIGAFWAEEFFRLWVGKEYVAESEYASAALLFQILIGGAVVTAGQRIGYQVLFGTRRLKRMALLFVCEALINLILSIALVIRMGLVGVAIGSLLPAIVFQGLLHPIVVCRALQIPWRSQIKNVYVWPMAFGVAAGVILAGVKWIAPPASGWTELIAYGFLAVALLLPGAIVAGFDRTERRRFAKRSLELMGRYSKSFAPGSREPKGSPVTQTHEGGLVSR